MAVVIRGIRWLSALLVLAVAGLVTWLAVTPPELLRLGTAYAAKIVCSNQFLALRDGDEVLATDVQAPGHPLLGYIFIDADPVGRTVSARFLGLFAEGRAIY